ncbi:MAG: hypothetical protein NC311_13370 [Muribaculaceae bacterium]|nr:hypothetical protein [Muribaculaceae bacterium]
MRQDPNCTPLMGAVFTNLAILAVWYLAEYAQFGELQTYRRCDSLVFILYFLLTWALFRACGRNREEDG